MSHPHPPTLNGICFLSLAAQGWGCAGTFHVPWKQRELGLSASEGNRVRGATSTRLLVPQTPVTCHFSHVHPQGGSFPFRGNRPCWELAVGVRAGMRWGCWAEKGGPGSAPASATICSWPVG